MNEIFTDTTSSFFYFLIAGSTIVYLILKFDKANRKKIKNVLEQSKDVQPMLLKKSAEHKIQSIKIASENDKLARAVVEQQLDELVAEYDKGYITLPDYCNKLNRLVAMTE
jgi:hypothetical protein